MRELIVYLVVCELGPWRVAFTLKGIPIWAFYVGEDESVEKRPPNWLEEPDDER